MKPEQSMRAYLAECALHTNVLEGALIDIKRWMPLSADMLYDKELLRVLDQVAFRFTRLQDSMGEKVLPLILELAQEPIRDHATFAEKLGYLERIGAIASAQEWKKLRAARNAVAHEYPDDPELRMSAINHFLSGALELTSTYHFVARYITTHFPELSFAEAEPRKQQ